MFGREWLRDTSGDGPASAGLLAGSGWEECAPAAGARLQHPETRIATLPEGQSVTSTWRGSALPWVMTRTLLVRPDGAVEARYEAWTTGSERLPFLWSALIPFNLDSRTRLGLPEGARLRVSAVQGATVAGGVEQGFVAQWPRLTLDGKSRDLGHPWSLPRAASISAWLELGKARATLQLWQGDERLTLTLDGAGVPYCGIIVDRAGIGTGGRKGMFGRAKHGAPAVALCPSLGAPDHLPDALGDWKAIIWLVPGEQRRWSMTLRGGS